ncbi:MAG: response regulator transcription factor [Rhodanobacter sp.]
MKISVGAIRVLIADDHPMMREGLRAAIDLESDMQVVGEAVDGLDAIEKFRQLNPDVTLLDLQMPKRDGLQVISDIRSSNPDSVIVVFTVYPGDARISRALALGATSYLLKSANRDEILAAVRGAISGNYVMGAEVSRELMNHRRDLDLTQREICVLKHVKTGMSNRAIAEALFVSEDTIKSHLKSIFLKLGVADRTHAVTIAVRRGFIDT